MVAAPSPHAARGAGLAREGGDAGFELFSPARRVVGLAVGGVGVIAAVIGSIWLARSFSLHDDAVADPVAVTAESTQMAAIDQHALGLGTLVVGLVAVAAGATLVLWPSSPEQRAAADPPPRDHAGAALLRADW